MHSDIDECWSTPCQHGGMCNDSVNGYECHCESGYTGVICEIGENLTFANVCLFKRSTFQRGLHYIIFTFTII